MSINRLFIHYEKTDTKEKPGGSFTTGEEILVIDKRGADSSLGPRLQYLSFGLSFQEELNQPYPNTALA